MNNASKIATVFSEPVKKPSALPVRAESLPTELKALPQWVVWRWQWRTNQQGKGQWTKPPVDATSFGNARSNDPGTWAPFAAAWQVYEDPDNNLDGIGFMLTEPFVGIDLDGCRDPHSGQIAAWAKRWIDRLNSYTEISPSGRGIKVLVKARVDWTGNKKGPIEMYRLTRYFTLTGHHLAGTPLTVEARQEPAERMHAEVFGTDEPRSKHQSAAPRDEPDLDDAELISRAMEASNGDKFCKLWQGRWEGDYASQSEADLALASLLAFWTGPNPDRVDRLFRRSGLMRDKWERDDYRRDTIHKAMASGEFYHGLAEVSSEDYEKLHALFRAKQRGSESTEPLPRIVVSNRQLRDITQDAISAIRQANHPPQWFQRGGVVCRLRTEAENGMSYFEPLKDKALRGILSRVADWKRAIRTENGTAYKNVSPPQDVVEDILGLPGWDFLPSVKGLIEAPVFDRDGHLLTETGYDPRTQLWFHPANGLTILPVAEKPSPADVARAKELLLDGLLGDFPFVDQASQAHALAAMLLPFVRPLIDGPTPLHALDAPTEGTGKGLLASCITLPATGREAATMPACHRAEEWQKQIMATLIRAPVFVLIDNVKHPLDSDTLASALTTRRHTDRLLGVSEMAEVPVQCVWLTAGNNLHASKEITRRMVRIRLDARMERPSQRTGFRHPDLMPWAKGHRSDLLWACLTLCQAWVAKGRPDGAYTLGSYERWARVMGGILDVVGVPGFLGNLDGLYREVNTTDGEWREFIHCWWARWQGAVIGSGDAYHLAMEKGLLGSAMGDRGERSQQSRFGRALSKRLHQCFGPFRIESGGEDRHGSACYKLVRLDEATTDAPSQATAADQTLATLTAGRVPLHVPAELLTGSDGAVSVVCRPLTEDEEEQLDWHTRFQFARRKDGRWAYSLHPPRRCC